MEIIHKTNKYWFTSCFPKREEPVKVIAKNNKMLYVIKKTTLLTSNEF